MRKMLMGMAAAVAIVGATVTLPTAAVADGHVVTVKSALSVPATIDKLEAALKSKGIGIMGRVDHAANAKKAGLELPPTLLLIFGNPKLGTPLMQSNRAIGMDLPMKALAWADKDGAVYLSYTKPDALKSRYGISDKDPVFKKMTGALANFSKAATAK
ncbi:MAG: DUF302 domain-containing protein [Pseudomonadota bacterium]